MKLEGRALIEKKGSVCMEKIMTNKAVKIFILNSEVRKHNQKVWRHY